MELKSPKKTIHRILQLGDVVVSHILGSYIVITTFDRNGSPSYVLKNFDGNGGYTGHHKSLESLTESLNEKDVVYPSKDFRLVLEAKEVF